MPRPSNRRGGGHESIITGTLPPDLSTEFLTRMAAAEATRHVEVGLDGMGNFRHEVD